MFMTVFSWLVCLCIGTAMCWYSIPRRFRLQMHANCFDHHQQFRERRAVRELYAFVDYLGGIALFAITIFVLVGIVLVYFDQHVVSLRIIGSALYVFDFDGGRWKANMRSVDVDGRFYADATNRGHSSGDVPELQQELWNAIPFAALLCFLAALLAIRVFERWYLLSMRRLIRGIENRYYEYSDYAFRRAVRRQAHERRKHSRRRVAYSKRSRPAGDT